MAMPNYQIEKSSKGFKFSALRPQSQKSVPSQSSRSQPLSATQPYSPQQTTRDVTADLPHFPQPINTNMRTLKNLHKALTALCFALCLIVRNPSPFTQTHCPLYSNMLGNRTFLFQAPRTPPWLSHNNNNVTLYSPTDCHLLPHNELPCIRCPLHGTSNWPRYDDPRKNDMRHSLVRL
jgi:hypothetical protein